jgi:hypothetical protein
MAKVSAAEQRLLDALEAPINDKHEKTLSKFARETFKKIVVDEVGWHPDEIDGYNDMDLVLIILNHLLGEIEELRDHTHNVT